MPKQTINTFNRFDSIKCKVIGRSQKGCFLEIEGIDERPIVRLYDHFMPIGSVILASIRKISEDRQYFKVSLDSVFHTGYNEFAA
jgi:hypothetical protein